MSKIALLKTKFFQFAFIIALVALAGSAAYGEAIIVVDAEMGGDFSAYDHSTDGDSTAGLTASYASTIVPSWGALLADDYYGTGLPGFFYPGSGESATWSVSGFMPGQAVGAYIHWRQGGQHNASPNASYSVNGRTAVLLDQTQPVPADLVLNDGVGPDLNYTLIGTYIADGNGTVSITMTAGVTGYSCIDSAALVVLAIGPDADGDGMSDLYEGFFQLNPTNSTDAVENHDTDLLINRAESALWTDPREDDTDADGFPDDADDNPLSRAVMMWAHPDFTEGDTYVYTAPDWWLGAGKSGGVWSNG